MIYSFVDQRKPSSLHTSLLLYLRITQNFCVKKVQTQNCIRKIWKSARLAMKIEIISIKKIVKTMEGKITEKTNEPATAYLLCPKKTLELFCKKKEKKLRTHTYNMRLPIRVISCLQISDICQRYLTRQTDTDTILLCPFVKHFSLISNFSTFFRVLLDLI